MIVVKLGGSLFDHPRLRVGLNSWLIRQTAPVLLVPGGGALADAVRAFDRLHGLGEEAAHWAALRSLSVTAAMVRTLLTVPAVEVLDAHAFCRADDELPHTWEVTTDSIALRVARVRNAERVVLLKSHARPPGTWEELATQGFVDRYFPTLATRAIPTIEVVHFRDWLDQA